MVVSGQRSDGRALAAPETSAGVGVRLKNPGPFLGSPG